MPNQVYDISWLDLSIGYILLSVPLFIFHRYKTGLVKDTIIAFLRMALQLFLVGLYLDVIFKYNSVYINVLWLSVMIIIATFTAIKRSEIKGYRFIVPIGGSLMVSMGLISFMFLIVVLKPDSFFNAQYFIPITGMIIGNCMERIIIALNSYYSTLNKEHEVYQYYLANGANRKEALKPFFSDALKKSFNPLIANTAVIGLIALPGMMTGQILGGSSPNVAIKYQILLMLCIFIASVMSVFLSLKWSTKFFLDDKENIVK
jgi:putative ABC transport system permease protein